jgi:RecA-family ATPase
MLVDVKSLKLTEPTFLVEDAIETPCTGMIFGASGSGKSFFVLDIALHCAAGVPWLGKTVKEGPVIYICGEGRHAVPRRVAAWESVHGAIPNGRFLMSQRRVQFDPDTILEMLCEINKLAAMSELPVLIVIDTMARALPGDCDENSAKDTMAFVDMCDRLQTQYNCSVIIIHHTGHSESSKDRARGSSAVKGAMDVEIMLDAGRGVIEWKKMKDAEPHLPVKYELVKTTYGDGPRDNSCTLKYDVKYDPTTEKMTKPAKTGAETLSVLCHKLGTTQIPEDTWREEFYAEYGGAKSACKVAFQRARKDLEAIKYIQIRGDVIHVKSVEVAGDSIEQAMFGHLLSNNGNNRNYN